jgi:histone acetyltransferase (RNA polymerase elongator complex component)
MIKAAGFHLILQMMTGLPGDTPGRCVETARRIIRLQPDGVRIYPTVIVKDTALYELWRAGQYREHTVEDAVAVCAQFVPLFEEAGVEIIRLGLNPTDELSAGAAVAGAYHPALGELVRARVMRQKALRLLQGIGRGSTVTLGVRAEELSQMIGQKRENVTAICATLWLAGLKVRSCAAEKGEIVILSVEKSGKV